jgi:signal transduction histidine kinase
MTRPLILRCRLLSQAASISCLLVGALALLAWGFDLERLGGAIPAWTLMQPNSALCFILAGAALWLRVVASPTPWQRYLAQGGASVAALLGLLTLGEHASSVDLGIDRWLVVNTSATASRAEQMTPTTSLYFLLIGLALWLVNGRPRLAQALALWAMVFPLVVLMAYPYSTEAASRFAFFTEVVVNTSLTFLLLALGVLCARPDHGVMAVATSPGPGGILVRRLVPVVFGLQIGGGYLRLAGQSQEIYRPEAGVALSVMVVTFALGWLVWRNARLLERMEAERRQAVERLHQVNRNLQETNQRLKETQTYLIHAEKMASLGQLVAGIAHEINNPLAFVMNNIYTITNALEQTAREVASRLSEPTLRKLEKAQDRLSDMKEGTERVKNLVLALRTFSRLDEGELKTVDVHESIDAVLRFLTHKMKERIQVEKRYGADGILACYAGQLNQVFMNVLANAVEAIKGEGKITVTTGREAGYFRIAIRDTGAGIPEAIRGRIFEPFFTTKPVGEGTGLGLAISYSIVQAHKGSIEVHSQEGQGTEVVIKIPLDLNGARGT